MTSDPALAGLAYHLPPELVAQAPFPQRDGSRLLVAGRASGRVVREGSFGSIGNDLRPGDLLVLNDTKVIPARLACRRETGGKAEVLLARPLPDGTWEALVHSGGRLRPGQRMQAGDRLSIRLVANGPDRTWRVALEADGELSGLLAAYGRTPLPPYIRRPPEPSDADRYQTVYAEVPGAVAAPTAGLHFTRELLASLESSGVGITRLTLHVGPGTFQPVTEEQLAAGRLHPEDFHIPERLPGAVAAARQSGGRVIAVGTTTLRALESACDDNGLPRPGPGETSLFIRPGHAFRTADGLLTNFHLPGTSLLLLVDAFLGGTGRVLDLYRHAVTERYRFYSYGDAMLIV